ncbi:MAG TPA: hypothetical protein PK050_11245 [Hyphomonadaceae bacterium]|nr:hypothetical protein [Hyphomonadaceae bacterium]
MNDLLQRYLAAVERRLPSGDGKAKAKSADIVAELREVLLSKIEAKEEALGRVATNDEVAEVLKTFGHPVVVASRYGGQDYVIGPNYYPWFWHVQRIAVGAALVIGFGIATVRGLGSDEPMRVAWRGVGSAIEIGLVVFAVVTALFIAAERCKLDMKWASKWNPKDLPRDNIRQPKTLFESAVTLALDVIFLLWWVKVVSFPAEIPAQDGRSVAFAFSPAWEVVYWPILALIVLATVTHAADMIHPAWTRVRSLASIAGHVAGLAILWVLYSSQPLVTMTVLNGPGTENTDRVLAIADSVVQVWLAVTAVIWVVAIGLEVRRLWRTRGSSTGGSNGGSLGSQQVVI